MNHEEGCPQHEGWGFCLCHKEPRGVFMPSPNKTSYNYNELLDAYDAGWEWAARDGNLMLKLIRDKLIELRDKLIEEQPEYIDAHNTPEYALLMAAASAYEATPQFKALNEVQDD